MMDDSHPHLKFVFHDAFHHMANHIWNSLFSEDEDYSNVVMDTHQYFAWGG